MFELITFMGQHGKMKLNTSFVISGHWITSLLKEIRRNVSNKQSVVCTICFAFPTSCNKHRIVRLLNDHNICTERAVPWGLLINQGNTHLFWQKWCASRQGKWWTLSARSSHQGPKVSIHLTHFPSKKKPPCLSTAQDTTALVLGPSSIRVLSDKGRKRPHIHFRDSECIELPN